MQRRHVGPGVAGAARRRRSVLGPTERSARRGRAHRVAGRRQRPGRQLRDRRYRGGDVHARAPAPAATLPLVCDGPGRDLDRGTDVGLSARAARRAAISSTTPTSRARAVRNGDGSYTYTIRGAAARRPTARLCSTRPSSPRASSPASRCSTAPTRWRFALFRTYTVGTVSYRGRRLADPGLPARHRDRARAARGGHARQLQPVPHDAAGARRHLPRHQAVRDLPHRGRRGQQQHRHRRRHAGDHRARRR